MWDWEPTNTCGIVNDSKSFEQSYQKEKLKKNLIEPK